MPHIPWDSARGFLFSRNSRSTMVTAHCVFFAELARLFRDELDAIRRKEWRIFVSLSTLEEERAYRAFMALHIPIYLLIFIDACSSSRTGNTVVR